MFWGKLVALHLPQLEIWFQHRESTPVRDCVRMCMSGRGGGFPDRGEERRGTSLRHECPFPSLPFQECEQLMMLQAAAMTSSSSLHTSTSQSLAPSIPARMSVTSAVAMTLPVTSQGRRVGGDSTMQELLSPKQVGGSMRKVHMCLGR